ncbi:LysE family translocator [Cohnella pontilimi]|uniref:LysE family translocator n=1 Tax=Cohnella pontilimi TaxID=2564100 RepID=A0A4U0F8X8_9BACL|nr:LysE family transporter [Cohnella pontilimi]TJY41091.1 LysE family translocator [Cohnella pontilimi]
MAPILKGIILGFSIAAPVGPIGVLCIRKTLDQGRIMGFAAGLGAATADAVYGSVAALGLSLVMQFLIKQSIWINVLGAVFLLYLAYKTFRAPIRHDHAPDIARLNYMKTFGTTLLLTLTNPLTIVSFVGIFAGMNIASESDQSLFLVLGVFVGSAIWWLFLISIVGSFRQMMSTRIMKWINSLSAFILLGFGMYSLYKTFM